MNTSMEMDRFEKFYRWANDRPQDELDQALTHHRTLLKFYDKRTQMMFEVWCHGAEHQPDEPNRLGDFVEFLGNYRQFRRDPYKLDRSTTHANSFLHDWTQELWWCFQNACNDDF